MALLVHLRVLHGLRDRLGLRLLLWRLLHAALRVGLSLGLCMGGDLLLHLRVLHLA